MFGVPPNTPKHPPNPSPQGTGKRIMVHVLFMVKTFMLQHPVNTLTITCY